MQEGTFVASSNDDQTEGYPLELSCTYTKSGANVPVDQYHGFCRFLTTTHMGTAALETGEKEAFEHIQAFLETYVHYDCQWEFTDGRIVLSM